MVGTAIRVLASAFLLSALHLETSGAGGPVEAQEAPPTGGDRPDALPAYRLVAPVGLGVFLDSFNGATNPTIAYLGAGAGLEARLTRRFGLRAEGQAVFALEEPNPTFEGAEAFFLPGAVLYLGDGPGDRPHLRGGPALGTSALGLGIFIGGGVPVGSPMRLRGRVVLSQDGPLLEAGGELALPLGGGG